jgi:type IV pilus assembly protein PilB
MVPQPHSPIGQIFVSEGILTADQLTNALVKKKADKRAGKLGTVLLELGLVSETQIARALSRQLNVPFVELATAQPAPEALARVPREVATTRRCLPWAIEGRDLRLVMADPTDLATVDAVQFRTGFRVKPLVAPSGDLAAAINKWYRTAEAPVNPFDAVNFLDQVAVVEEETEDSAISEAELQKSAEEAPVIRLVAGIIADAIRNRASDIHIEPHATGVKLRYRIDGALQHIITLPPRTHARIVSRIKVTAHMNIAERRRPQDGGSRVVLEGETFDLRISTLPTVDGEKVVIRILPRSRATIELDDLGFDPEVLTGFRGLLQSPQGMLLVTGPTGSGKTSTLYGALNYLSNESRNIVTIEDPVEYRLPGINQVAVAERAGVSFASGLRSILRQDPNIIMVGEIRDTETAQVAFHAAQTGHLVLATLHTNDAPSAVIRLVEMGIPSFLVAASVIGVLAQRLVRTVCPCRQGDARAEAGANCDRCKGTGFYGRMAVHELLTLTPGVRETLFSTASTDLLREAARRAGMTTLFEDGMRKVTQGHTTLEELTRVVLPSEWSSRPRPYRVVSAADSGSEAADTLEHLNDGGGGLALEARERVPIPSGA